MQITPAELAKQLSKPLAPFYLLFGDEAWLIAQSAAAIRKVARQNGIEEQVTIDASAQMNWEDFFARTHQSSLFCERQLFECRFNTGKVSETAKKALIEYAQTIDPAAPVNTHLIVILPKLTKAQQNAAWFKKLSANAITVAFSPIRGKDMPAWLARRFRARGLQYTNEALNFMTNAFEGNLAAAADAIEQLSLRLEAGATVTLDDLQAGTVTVAQFDMFALIDTLHAGQRERALLMLQRLNEQGTAPMALLWMLGREIRLLIRIHAHLQQNHSWPAIFKAEHLWQSRQGPLQKAIKRLSIDDCHTALAYCAQVDALGKGAMPNVAVTVTQAISALCLYLCAGPEHVQLYTQVS